MTQILVCLASLFNFDLKLWRQIILPKPTWLTSRQRRIFRKKLEETECIDTQLFANNNHLSRDLKKKFFDFLYDIKIITWHFSYCTPHVYQPLNLTAFELIYSNLQCHRIRYKNAMLKSNLITNPSPSFFCCFFTTLSANERQS